MAVGRRDLDLPTMTIGLLLSAARRLLTQAGEEPQCKVERVLEWRKAFHTLGVQRADARGKRAGRKASKSLAIWLE